MAHRGSRGIDLPFLGHGTRRGRGVSVTPRPLFTPITDLFPLYRRLGGPQGRSGQVRKISPPPGFHPRTVQPVASRYFKDEKILNTPSFGAEVKLSVPCRRFAACKRSIELHVSRFLGKICRNIFRPQRVPLSATRGLSRRWT